MVRTIAPAGSKAPFSPHPEGTRAGEAGASDLRGGLRRVYSAGTAPSCGVRTLRNTARAVVLSCWWFGSAAPVGAAPLAAPRGLMQTKRGEVNYTKPPALPVPAAVPQVLEVKDHLAVGESSWAILRFQDASEIKVRELTQLEIVEPAVMRGASFRLLKGEASSSGLRRSPAIP